MVHFREGQVEASNRDCSGMGEPAPKPCLPLQVSNPHWLLFEWGSPGNLASSH